MILSSLLKVLRVLALPVRLGVLGVLNRHVIVEMDVLVLTVGCNVERDRKAKKTECVRKTGDVLDLFAHQSLGIFKSVIACVVIDI
jgi:hypothetical protein